MCFWNPVEQPFVKTIACVTQKKNDVDSSQGYKFVDSWDCIVWLKGPLISGSDLNKVLPNVHTFVYKVAKQLIHLSKLHVVFLPPCSTQLKKL
jgi:hypothetical protein